MSEISHRLVKDSQASLAQPGVHEGFLLVLLVLIYGKPISRALCMDYRVSACAMAGTKQHSPSWAPTPSPGSAVGTGSGCDVNSKADPILGQELHKPAGPGYLESSMLCSKLLISLPGKAQIPSKKHIHFQSPAPAPRSHL